MVMSWQTNEQIWLDHANPWVYSLLTEFSVHYPLSSWRLGTFFVCLRWSTKNAPVRGLRRSGNFRVSRVRATNATLIRPGEHDLNEYVGRMVGSIRVPSCLGLLVMLPMASSDSSEYLHEITGYYNRLW